VSFALARPGRVELLVFDLMGRQVRTLARGPMTAGSQRRVWDGRRTDGSDAPAGVYFVRLVTPGGHWTRTLVRIR
jgi:flagellar hook assembly protein FlgD